MENGREKIIIHPGELDAEARQAFAGLLAPGIDTGGGLQSVDDLLAGCSLFEWEKNGVIVSRHALTVRQYAHGSEGVIVGAVGRAMVGFEKSVAVIEAQLPEVDSVAVWTKRMGMVKQLARCGYAVDAFILRKRITRGHS